MDTIVEQLTDIYDKYEDWHITKLSREQALRYHENALNRGDIYVYEENKEVLGYYERHFVYNVCFLDNIWVRPCLRKGEIFKKLHKHFFETMPLNITCVLGERHKRGGRIEKFKIRRSYGKYKD
jgi:hypothetical protein